jgi:hypothetical protein
MKRKRTPPHRVNRKQRASAIAALSKIVADESVAPYVQAKAASALLGADRAAADEPQRDPDAPRKFVILPANGRDANVRYGLYDDDQIVVQVPTGWPMEVMPESHYRDVPKPVGVADRLARIRAAERLALPAPDEDDGEPEPSFAIA